MTSSARDLRYGRRGGAWLEARHGEGVCHTCRNGVARWRATHRRTQETWPSCERCRQQARRYRRPISHQPHEEASTDAP